MNNLGYRDGGKMARDGEDEIQETAEALRIPRIVAPSCLVLSPILPGLFVSLGYLLRPTAKPNIQNTTLS